MYEKRNNNNNARNRKILLTAWGVVIVVAYVNDKSNTVKGYFEDKDLFDIAEEGKIVVVDGFGQVKEIKQ